MLPYSFSPSARQAAPSIQNPKTYSGDWLGGVCPVAHPQHSSVEAWLSDSHSHGCSLDWGWGRGGGQETWFH